MTLTILAVS